ncbi:N-acetylglucosamine-6-phosphate deacetylase [Alteromonas oceanisediminis]|uniref:N-acetylglucosamine-6-phosphate deacetylase n=1 Tax=Alteromonas oceanisediminis TaxID=2836180 RepID=UPI001BD9A339|nr:N-acetylglucosamine-6-phosphate deacetylase [Alteromonas oceanisediminis]MBT0586786.1 N-acetylglucosamine-6-phosphate deacetylase [Alteromonas oceanisediminis]
MKLAFKKIHTPLGWLYDHTISVKDGKIADIHPTQAGDSPSFQGNMAVPGYIDIQVNGGGGVLLNQMPSAEGVSRIFKAHQQYGTTAMLPTLITDCFETMQLAADGIAEARRDLSLGIVGAHFEGPWLSEARKGVHSAHHLRRPVEQELALLRQSNLGKVMVTVAPEQVAPQIIREMTQDGIVVFLGHSNAPANDVEAALDAGAVGFTHLYNAMSPMQSREPGMVGTALASEQSFAGLIVDGHHVSQTCCRVAIRAKGVNKIALVTDAMALAATSESHMPFFDTEIRRDNDKLTTPDGTLAGSCLTMRDAVKNTVSLCATPLTDAIQMATLTPATLLGLNHVMGKIDISYQANILSLNEQLDIEQVVQYGKVVSPTITKASL